MAASVASSWTILLFHLPNYALSAVLYSMFGRFALGLFLPPQSPNYIYRWFRLLTEPFVRATAFVTPSFVRPVCLPLIAMFWLTVVRLVFFGVMFNLGFVPTLAPQS
jgi:YggT family protein